MQFLRVDEVGGTSGDIDAVLGPTGGRLANRTGSNPWLIADLLGNVAGSYDTSGLRSAIRYNGYGEVTASWAASGAAANPWRFQGRYDITADNATTANVHPLYDMSARFYAPALGTFTQLDSVAGAAGDPISLNRYLYAAASPWSMVDPTGHTFCNANNYPDNCDGFAPGGWRPPVAKPTKPRHRTHVTHPAQTNGSGDGGTWNTNPCLSCHTGGATTPAGGSTVTPYRAGYFPGPYGTAGGPCQGHDAYDSHSLLCTPVTDTPITREHAAGAVVALAITAVTIAGCAATAVAGCIAVGAAAAAASVAVDMLPTSSAFKDAFGATNTVIALASLGMLAKMGVEVGLSKLGSRGASTASTAGADTTASVVNAGSPALNPLGGAAPGSPATLVAGQEWEAANLPTGSVKAPLFRPTDDQAGSAAFNVIVGEARTTAGGRLTGTIVDAPGLELKGGSSPLRLTYQIRLQVYRSMIMNEPLTIRTSRPVMNAVADWLARWGVQIEVVP